MKKKKLLVTGTLGFIFSNFVRKILYEKLPYELITVDKAALPNSLNNIYINKGNTSNYIADISDQHVMDRIFEFERPDIVINGAAESNVDLSIKDPSIFIKSNVLGTQALINSSVKYGVEKFIFISTDEVYGSMNNESEPSWTEDSPLNPRNPYSASKASAELLVKAAHNTFGLNYNITRTCNNYGPRQTPDKLIPRIIKSIQNKEPIPIYGQGLNIREWIYVADNCDGILTVLEKGNVNETYNISSGAELTNIEMVQKVCNAMGEGHNLIKHIPDPRPGHDYRYSVNSSKLRALGWKPKYSLSDGLIATSNWYIANQWFVR